MEDRKSQLCQQIKWGLGTGLCTLRQLFSLFIGTLTGKVWPTTTNTFWEMLGIEGNSCVQYGHATLEGFALVLERERGFSQMGISTAMVSGSEPGNMSNSLPNSEDAASNSSRNCRKF